MSQQTWNFAAIRGAIGEVHGAVGQTDGLLDEGKASLGALASVWGGSGSDAYQAVQARWDSTSAELNASLRNLAQTMEEATSTMESTEHAVTGMF
jgi:early secretory antigenic target protein ESAT-6